jgi:hypothetical protein
MEEEKRFIVPEVLNYQETWNDPTPETDSSRDDNSLPDGNESPEATRGQTRTIQRPGHIHTRRQTWFTIQYIQAHYCLTTAETANLWYVRGPKSSGCTMTCLISPILKKTLLNSMRESPSDPILKADSNPSPGAAPPQTIFWLS